MIDIINEENNSTKIKVVGVGGGGQNAVNRMITAKVTGVDFVTINTDVQALKGSNASIKLQIGNKLTKGLGAGADPEVGRKAAQEDKDLISQTLENTDMVFIAAGMGGGTGTGAAPVVAEISKELGILTIAVVTKPFQFEGSKRMQNAEDGLKGLKDKVDSIIIIPNSRLKGVVERNLTWFESFKYADDILRQGVQGISDIITNAGYINLDFADIRTIMRDSGESLMGIGSGKGDKKAQEAAKKALSCPLLEDVDLANSTKIIYNITAGSDVTQLELEEAGEIISKAVNPDANIIFGIVNDQNMHDEMKITVVATGFSKKQKGVKLEAVKTASVGASSWQRRLGLGADLSQDDMDIPAFLRRKAD